jgi:hypothetical protein
MPAIKIARMLPPIPPDPEPTEKQIDTELRKVKFDKSLSSEKRRQFAAVFWRSDRRLKSPNKFWHPFAPDPRWYKDYLNSDMWRRISEKIKTDAGHKCACCPKKSTQVHHRCYRPRVLSGEDTSLLIALCGTCHKAVDRDKGGKPREANAKESTLAEMFNRESKRLALLDRSPRPLKPFVHRIRRH